MKNVILSLSLVMFATVSIAGQEPVKAEVVQSEPRDTIFGSVYQNVQDLMPFLFTTGISVLMGKLQPKEGEQNANYFPLLKYAAIIVPSAVSASNAYRGVVTIRETRKFVGDDVESQDALTRQQDKLIADYGVNIPLSLAAAYRLATSDDAGARIAYIVGSYLLASGDKSPFEHVKSWGANMLDAWRLQKPEAKTGT